MSAHLAPPPSWAARARKFLVGAGGLLALIVSSGVLNGNPAEPYVNGALAVLTALGIYTVPNAPTASK